MRTNIEIDDDLMQQAMKATNTATKKAAVEASLRQTVQLKKQEGIRELFGKVQWDGDLDAIRQSRVLEWEEDHVRPGQENSEHPATVKRKQLPGVKEATRKWSS